MPLFDEKIEMELERKCVLMGVMGGIGLMGSPP